MGNHEYCEECGASDFHLGRTCQEAYPKKYIEMQEAKRKDEERKQRLLPKFLAFKQELQSRGIRFWGGNSEDTISISWAGMPEE